MRPPHVFANVTAEAQAEILALLRGRYRVAARLVMVLLSARGLSPSQIGALLDYHPGTVRRWLTRFQAAGPAGLADRPRTGRPHAGGPRLVERITAVLATPKAWTVARLWHQLGRPHVSLATLRRRVAQVAAWRRPRLVAKGSPQAAAITATIRAQLTALPAGSVVCTADETHIQLLPWIRASWVLRGTRQHVITPGTNIRRSVFGALNVVTGAWHYRVTFKAASAQFIELCTLLLATYPTAPTLAVITDGGTCHTSKLTQDWVATQPRLRLLIGAPYSPHDNPTERVWAALKRWLANNPTVTIGARTRQVHAFFRTRSPAQMLTTAAPHSSPWLPDGYTQNYCRPA